MKNGICVAGNAIVDILYPIERYPQKGELTTITEGISRATGGAMCNTIMGLAALDPTLGLHAIGVIGDDEEGAFVTAQMERHKNISLRGMKRRGKTSFTSVMCENTSKQRTFFQYRGANATLGEDDFDWADIHADILHIGYILLLDTLDEEDAEYGTRMARLLKQAQAHGLKTSIDVVSESGNRFARLVPPALKYSDYCIINEVEAQQATGVPLREGEALIEGSMKEALQKLFDMGVSTWAIIHAPEGGFGMDAHGAYEAVESLRLPDGFIRGTVGAGDAFCAGVLYGAYNEKTLREAITMGTAAAACSLSAEGATEGMQTMEAAMRQYDEIRGGSR